MAKSAPTRIFVGRPLGQWEVCGSHNGSSQVVGGGMVEKAEHVKQGDLSGGWDGKALP